MNKTDIIEQLDLTKHREGGYFRRTYESDRIITINNSTRHIMTSIFYLLTDDSPVGHFHLNKSDVIHYFQSGSPITYLIISPQGELSKVILGPDLTKGHALQLTVKGGCWKASILDPQGEYGLISEAVAPGFDYADAAMATKVEMREAFPHIWGQIETYIY